MWTTNVSDKRLCTLRISSQTNTFGFVRFRNAFLQLSSGDWFNTPTLAQNGSRFYASAELQLTSFWPGATDDFLIEQIGQPTTSPSLSFRVWVRIYGQAGSGHYTATTPNPTPAIPGQPTAAWNMLHPRVKSSLLPWSRDPHPIDRLSQKIVSVFFITSKIVNTKYCLFYYPFLIQKLSFF